ncbi:pantothenate transporter liz1 [Fusarium coicis]|nr:pantothenate transporter liz1 [Fusarium coicis]
MYKDERCQSGSNSFSSFRATTPISFNSSMYNSMDIEKKPHSSTDENESCDSKSQGQVISPKPEALQHLSDEELTALEKRLRHKIDLRLLPCMILIYIMNYLARLGGLEEDLGLKGNEFQTAVSVLFVGYVLIQVPSNMLLNKIGKPASYLTACVIGWGALCASTGAVHSFRTLTAVRFLLGFVEAAFYPGAMATLSAWYVRKELGVRTAIFYTGPLISGDFSGLIAAGIIDGMNGVGGLLAWLWIFILEGSATVVIAFCCYWILRDFPATTNWLTEEKRPIALWRIKVDAADEQDWTASSSQRLPLVVGLRYFGAMIMLPSIYSGFNMSMYPWILPVPQWRRAAFHPCFSVNAAMATIAIIAGIALHLVLKRANRKLELKEAEEEAAGRHLPGSGLRYLT